MFQFGDIVSIDVSFSDGSEKKIRPVCIIARDQQDYIFFHMTSQESGIIKTDYSVDPDVNNNLKTKTRIRLRKISTYHESLIRKKIGNLSKDDKKMIKTSLKEFVD